MPGFGPQHMVSTVGTKCLFLIIPYQLEPYLRDLGTVHDIADGSQLDVLVVPLIATFPDTIER